MTPIGEAPKLAPFTLRGHNPDVLNTIANLSNDEVFTPPELANQMLDMLEKAWADGNNGANIWADHTVTFLDPFTKSGVFLREITARLVKGLEEWMPDLQQRVNHILTKQVFGIGITQLTSLLARRSVYCSKSATGKHSIVKTFDRDWGNIWFERTEHTWVGGTEKVITMDENGKTVLKATNGRCKYCGAQQKIFHRSEVLESHAYAFIHTDDIKARMAELFGENMRFDVIIGNPPYQMSGASGGSSDASIYHLFVEQAQKMEPQALVMVTPSRWMAGGRGMNDFRARMLNDSHLSHIVDFPDSSEAFPGVQIKGGVSYFLWSPHFVGKTEVTTVTRGERQVQKGRDLEEFDVFVRDGRAVSILRKVLAHKSRSIAEQISNDTPFGIATNFERFALSKSNGNDVMLFYIRSGRREVAWVAKKEIQKNVADISLWKVLLPEAYGAGESFPHQILGKPVLAPPNSVCTQSYLYAKGFQNDSEARSFKSYYATRFFRFLVSQRKITQHALRSTYQWVPEQSWDRAWSDEELYEKYCLSAEEIDFIESMIRPMELSDD